MVTGEQYRTTGGFHAAQGDLHAVDGVVRGPFHDRERTTALWARDHVANPGHRAAIQVSARNAIKYDAAMVRGIAYADNFSAHITPLPNFSATTFIINAYTR